MARFDLSQRRACRGSSVDPKTVRREPVPDCSDVRARMRAIASERRRFGYRRIGLVLEREDFVMNSKKPRRLDKEESLAVRRRRRDHNDVQPHSAPGGLNPAQARRASEVPEGWATAALAPAPVISHQAPGPPSGLRASGGAGQPRTSRGRSSLRRLSNDAAHRRNLVGSAHGLDNSSSLRVETPAIHASRSGPRPPSVRGRWRAPPAPSRPACAAPGSPGSRTRSAAWGPGGSEAPGGFRASGHGSRCGPGAALGRALMAPRADQALDIGLHDDAEHALGEAAEKDLVSDVPPLDRGTPDCVYAASGTRSIWSRRNWAGERWLCRSISQCSL